MEQENIKKDTVSNLMKYKKYFIIGGVVIGVLIIIGFISGSFSTKNRAEKIAEDILEREYGGSVNIDSDNNSVSIKSEKGNFDLGNTAKWPSNIPGDIPEFTVGKITMATSTENGWQILANEVTKEDYDSYHSALIAKGWTDYAGTVYNKEFGMVQMIKTGYDLVLAFNPQDNSLSLMISINE